METFSALLAICAGNSPVAGEFAAQRPVTRSFDVFFDLRLNKRLSKQSWGWWFETLSRPLWRHRNVADALVPMMSLLYKHQSKGMDDQSYPTYRKTSCTSRTKSQSLNVSCIPVQLFSLNPLKPGVKLRMKM